MKIKFTSLKVIKFEPPSNGKNQTFYWDTETQGLSVRVTANEKRAYIYQGRVKDKTIRITIGDVNTWSLDDARKEARRLQQLCDTGIDPRRQKAEEQQKNDEYHHNQQLNNITLEQVFDEYVEENKKNWSERHLEDHYTIKRTLLKPLLDMPLIDINQDTIIKWQNGEQHRPGRASLAFRLLRACINWCVEHDTYKNLTSKEIHSQKRVRKSVPTLKPRKQTLEKNQLADWFRAVDSLDNIINKTFIKVTLLTGARSESLRSLEWSHVDLQWGTLKIWDKIEQEYRTIPLTNHVRLLLTTLPKNENNDFVFWSDKSKSGYIEDVRKIYYQALDDYNLPHFSIHDLRRSFSNLSEWLDIPAGIVAQIMGHKPSATAEKHYKNRPVELLKVHHQRFEDWIIEQAYNK